jgi:hypothetical protein
MNERDGRIATLLVSPWGVLLGALLALTLAAAPPYPNLESDRTPGPAPLAAYNGLDPFTASQPFEGGNLLEPGAGWVSFTWYGEGPALDREGPFWIEADFPVTLRVTDDFCTGDRFRIYDNGAELAETFDTTKGPGSIRGPDAAFRDARWTSGIYSLAGGRHELRIQAADNPWKMGRGYVRIDRESTFATFASEDLSENFGPVRGADSFRTTSAIALGEDSDGILPNFEEVVVSFGRYLEVIPAGSFVCNEIDCEYVSAGPGITRAVLRTTGFHFEADRVRLCPGSNPLVVGVWIGNDGGAMRFRCQGRLHD